MYVLALFRLNRTTSCPDAASRDVSEYPETQLRKVNDSFETGIVSEVVSTRKMRKLRRWFSDVKFCVATESKTPDEEMGEVLLV